MYPALFEYKCKNRQNSVPAVNPRSGPSFELDGNFLPRRDLNYFHIPHVNNRFSSRYSDADLVGKSKFSRQLHLNLSAKQAQLFNKFHPFKSKVSHLYIEITQVVSEDGYYASPPLSEIGVDTYPNLKEITINICDKGFGYFLKYYMQDHFLGKLFMNIFLSTILCFI